MSAHVDDYGGCDESAGNGAAAMFAMFCLTASLSISLSVLLAHVPFVPFLSLSVNEAFVLVHASKLIKEFNIVNLLRLVETFANKGTENRQCRLCSCNYCSLFP